MNSSNTFLTIDKLSVEQIEQLHTFYQNEWWSKGRSLTETQELLKHSDFVFGVCDSTTQQLLAFARVLTDHVFKALILDVIVRPDQRGAGLGAALMEKILQHPVLSKVQHVELYCLPERVAFYQRLGFSSDLRELKFMRRIRS
jgi:predicted GNAT family N-acyltransferase